MRRRRLRPRPIMASLAAGVVVIVLGVPGSDARAASTTITVSLAGTGSFDPYQEQISWDNDLQSAGLDPGYIPLSGYLGRQELLSGAVDYAISGVPFTPGELAQLPGGANDLVSAPVFVSGIGVLLSPPTGDGFGGFQVQHWPCDPNQLDCQLNSAPTSSSPYDGPINVPPAELAAIMLDNSLPIPNPTPIEVNDEISRYDEWDNPDITAASGSLGANDSFVPGVVSTGFIPALYPQTVVQSGADEDNYYAQLYAATAAPAQWTAVEQYAEGMIPFASTPPSPLQITEFLPGRVAFGQKSKQGLRQAVQAVEAQSATIGLVSPSGKYQFDTDPPSEHQLNETVQWIGVQNASGQYVTPSPASIDAAVNAGNDNPLYALTHQVSGDSPAYPLTYVDDLYAPAHGLSQAKTEALATLIRYLATAGQEYDATFGDGRLSPQLTNEALSAANQLVLSNCTQSGETVVASSDPGSLMPRLPSGSAGAKDIAAIGSMLHCRTVSPPSTSTTTSTTIASIATTRAGLPGGATTLAPSSVTGSSASSGSVTGSVASSASGSTPPAASSNAPGSSLTSAPSVSRPTAFARAPNGAASTGTLSNGSGASGSAGGKPISLANLPLPLPWSGAPVFDRLAGLGLGAAIVLLARRPTRWLIRALKP